MSEYIVKVEGQKPDAIYERELTEIVRCHDCKHTRKSWNGKRPDFVPDGFFCAYWGGHQLWKPDGFCAWACRKGVDE